MHLQYHPQKPSKIISPLPIKVFAIALIGLLLNACSMGQMVARSSLPLVESGNRAMNRETDFELARAAIPANLKLIESLIAELPGNPELRAQAAQGFYGYAYGFIEDEDHERAASLYQRAVEHALHALKANGLKGDPMTLPLAKLKPQLAELNRKAVPALFWAASAWGKWIDMSRDDPARIAEIGKATALMERVLELDENYFYGGAHMFFGSFYGSFPATFGGDAKLSAMHFDKARARTQGKLLIVDMLRAQYLDRQLSDRKSFHDRLTAIVNTPPNLFPEMALVNAVAQHKAKLLLAKEEEWF